MREVAEIKEQCRIESTNQCKSIVEKELLADKEEAMESCEMREVAEIEKVECRRQQLSQSRPSQEVESYCSIIAVRMEQRHRAGAAIRRSASWMIENLEAASQAYTINVQAALHGVRAGCQDNCGSCRRGGVAGATKARMGAARV